MTREEFFERTYAGEAFSERTYAEEVTPLIRSGEVSFEELKETWAEPIEGVKITRSKKTFLETIHRSGRLGSEESFIRVAKELDNPKANHIGYAGGKVEAYPDFRRLEDIEGEFTAADFWEDGFDTFCYSESGNLIYNIYEGACGGYIGAVGAEKKGGLL